MKKIKNRGVHCNSLCIPKFLVLILAQKVFSLGHMKVSRDKHIPVESGTPILQRSDLKLYHKRRNA